MAARLTGTDISMTGAQFRLRDTASRGAFGVVCALMMLVLTAFSLAGCDSAEPAGRSQGAIEVTDMRGRTVRIEAPVKKIAIDDSRYLVALSLIADDPVSLLAAWAHDDNRLGSDAYQKFALTAPRLDDLPRIASSAENFDVESIIAARPDVAVLSVESGVTEAQIERVEAAGIPVLVLDFFADPMENLEPSLLILGRLTGKEAKAREFIAFRQKKLDTIAARVADLPDDDRTLVFLEAHAGSTPDCCNSAGRGNASDYMQFVGGHNIGADAISQSSGKLNLEYVISRNPQVYIATGGPHLAERGGLVVGPGTSAEEARASLAQVASRRGIADLSAVREGRTYAFSHQLLNSPLDIVAVETFAKWLHPDIFADVSPETTLQELNSRFLSVPYQGQFWVSLDN